MPVTSMEAKIRLNAGIIARTVVTGSNRVKLGIVDEAAGNTFFKTMVADGPFVVILPAQNGPWNAQQMHMDIIVPVRMYFGAAGDADYDFTAAEDVWVAMRNALSLASNWSGRSVPSAPPESWTFRGPTPRSDLKPMVFMYEFEMTFPGACIGGGFVSANSLLTNGFEVKTNGRDVLVAA